MSQFMLSFIRGFFVTSGLFVLCYACVLGMKVLALHFKRYLLRDSIPDKAPDLNQKIRTSARKNPKKPTRTVHNKRPRSIEIDPDKIDRIYVKKIS